MNVMADALSSMEAAAAVTDKELEVMAGRIALAGTDVPEEGSSWADICAWWRAHQDVLESGIAFLQKGKVKILIISVGLPKFLRAFGDVLAKVNVAILGACPAAER